MTSSWRVSRTRSSVSATWTPPWTSAGLDEAIDRRELLRRAAHAHRGRGGAAERRQGGAATPRRHRRRLLRLRAHAEGGGRVGRRSRRRTRISRCPRCCVWRPASPASSCVRSPTARRSWRSCGVSPRATSTVSWSRKSRVGRNASSSGASRTSPSSSSSPCPPSDSLSSIVRRTSPWVRAPAPILALPHASRRGNGQRRHALRRAVCEEPTRARLPREGEVGAGDAARTPPAQRPRRPAPLRALSPARRPPRHHAGARSRHDDSLASSSSPTSRRRSRRKRPTTATFPSSPSSTCCCATRQSSPRTPSRRCATSWNSSTQTTSACACPP